MISRLRLASLALVACAPGAPATTPSLPPVTIDDGEEQPEMPEERDLVKPPGPADELDRVEEDPEDGRGPSPPRVAGGPSPAPGSTKASSDLGKPPQPSPGLHCTFPPQADVEQIDEAVVMLSVTVEADGGIKNLTLVSDPGFGFGEAAMRCIEHSRFTPATDRAGAPIEAKTVVRVRFAR